MNMNTRTIRIIALFVTLAAAAVSVTGAKEQSVPKSKGVAVKSAPFEVTGVFSGSLTGEIVIDGQSVFITDKTTFYQVGVGPAESGRGLSNTAVYVGGVMKGKKAIATLVVIGEEEVSADFSQSTIANSDRDPAGEAR
jgi:hypothetical protein